MTALFARDLPPLPPGDAYTAALTVLVERANGLVYHGDRMNAVLDAVKVLRADPGLAARLLGEVGQ